MKGGREREGEGWLESFWTATLPLLTSSSRIHPDFFGFLVTYQRPTDPDKHSFFFKRERERERGMLVDKTLVRTMIHGATWSMNIGGFVAVLRRNRVRCTPNGLCTWTEEEIHWYVIENVGNHSQPCSSSRLHFPFLRSFFLRFSLFRHSSRGGMGDPSLVLSLGSLERLSSSRFSFFELLPLLSKERERERTGNVFR